MATINRSPLWKELVGFQSLQPWHCSFRSPLSQRASVSGWNAVPSDLVLNVCRVLPQFEKKAISAGLERTLQ